MFRTYLSAAVAWAAVAGYAMAEERTNLLPNGSFEDGLAGWLPAVHDPARTGGAVTADRARARHGARSLKIDLPGPGNASVASPPAPVRSGQDCLLTFWYRSEGFSETGLYAGVNLQYVVTWLDREKKPLGTGGAGLSYGAVPQWRFMIQMLTSPPGAAFMTVSFPMSVNEKGRPSRVWLDCVQLRSWPGEPKPGGKTWTFHVADGHFQQDLFRRVADDDTPTGFAVLGNPRFQQKSGYLAGGVYTRELPPGQYRAVFRLKLAKSPPRPQPVLAWDVNTDAIGFLSAGTISQADFRQPGTYQDFPVRFVLPPGVQWIDPRLTWNGGAAVWIDTIMLVEERVFNGEDLKALLD